MAETEHGTGDSSANGQLTGRKRRWPGSSDDTPEKDVPETDQAHAPEHPEGTGHLLDLPVEILEKILAHLDNYADVQRARRVCRQLRGASAFVLRSAYLQLERDLSHDVPILRQCLDQKISNLEDHPPAGFPVNYEGKESMAQLCESIFQLEVLKSTFNIVAATIRSLRCMHSEYDAELLYAFYTVRNEIMRGSDRGPGTTPATKESLRRCREAAAKSINQFIGRMEEKRRLIENPNKFEILSAISSLETLLICNDANSTTPYLTRYDGGVVTLSVWVFLQNCWLGLEATDDYLARSPAERVRDVFQVLRELVWNSNYESCLYALKKRLAWIGTPNESNEFIADIPFHLRTEIDIVDITNDPRLRRTFEAVDVDNARVYFYGHTPRVSAQPALADDDVEEDEQPVMFVEEDEQPVMFGDSVVMIPLSFRKGLLELRYEITCCEDMLPKDLCEKAIVLNRAWDSTKAPFYLQIASHEDFTMRNSRCYEFQCHASGSGNLSQESEQTEESRQDEDEPCSEPPAKRNCITSDEN